MLWLGVWRRPRWIRVMNFDSKLAQKFVCDAAWPCLGHMEELINSLGVEQICVGVNKMDCDIAGYEQSRYDEMAN